MTAEREPCPPSGAPVGTASLVTGLALAAGAPTLALAGAWEWSLTCAILALAVSLGRLAPELLGRRLTAVTVRGMSMLPTYQDGDRVLVRRSHKPAQGQVIVVEACGADARWHGRPLPHAARADELSHRHWIIKRVAAVPGDPVPHHQFPALAAAPEDQVPEGKLVLLGDNPHVSFDSRMVGYFPLERVLGTVLTRLSPRDGPA